MKFISIHLYLLIFPPNSEIHLISYEANLLGFVYSQWNQDKALGLGVNISVVSFRCRNLYNYLNSLSVCSFQILWYKTVRDPRALSGNPSCTRGIHKETSHPGMLLTWKTLNYKKCLLKIGLLHSADKVWLALSPPPLDCACQRACFTGSPCSLSFSLGWEFLGRQSGHRTGSFWPPCWSSAVSWCLPRACTPGDSQVGPLNPLCSDEAN